MIKSILVITASFMIVALPAWGLDMVPGKYEITSKVEMPGMPGTVPPQTITQCLTEADPVPGNSAGAQGCEVTEMKTRGNTITYTMECDQQGMKMKCAGHMTFTGDAFQGTSKMEMGPSAGGMTVTTNISGKRIGACD